MKSTQARPLRIAALLVLPLACGSSGGDGGSGSGGGASSTSTSSTGGSSSTTVTGGGGGAGTGTGTWKDGAPAAANSCPASVTPLPQAVVPAGFCIWAFASGIDRPRGLIVDGEGQVLVVEAGTGSIWQLRDEDGDGVSAEAERSLIASAPGLNHGIALVGESLYASSDSTVYRWTYTGAAAALGSAETVVTGLPSGGNHVTRTLEPDGSGGLYVNIGSEGNLDADSSRARVVHFSSTQLQLGATFGEAAVWADGTRNEVGLHRDGWGRLWGIQNGSDSLLWSDGTDIHEDNPGEELNLLAQPGFYGYPFCWSEGLLPEVGSGPGTQWSYEPAGEWSHEDCQDPTCVIPPVLSLQAHSAPLDLHFYEGGSFPEEYFHDLFVPYHGSWNRSVATGYKVVRVRFGADGLPTGEVEDFARGSSDADPTSWSLRPVALDQGPAGELYVSSDQSNSIIAIGYAGE